MQSKYVLAALLAASSSAFAFSFKPAVKAEFRGVFESQQATKSDDFSGQGNLFLVPGMDLSEKLSLSPVLAYILKSRDRDVYPDEELPFAQSHTFLGKPVFKYNLNDKWDAKLWGTAKHTINRETRGEDWSKGLYDYEEFGVGAGTDWKPAAWGIGKGSLGLEYHHRDYPNWHEAAAYLTQNKNYYTKDYNGLKLSLDVASPKKQAFTWDSGLVWLSKGYTDSYQVKKDGTLDLGLLRGDNLLRWDANAGLERGAWKLYGGPGVDWNTSNQNFFDPGSNTPVLDFYGYLATTLTLGLSWKGWHDLVLDGNIRFTNRVYSGRSIRNSDGAYTQGKQADFEQDYSLEAAYPLPWGLAAVAGFDYLNVQSNQGFQSKILTTYDLTKVSLGLSYQL